MVIILSRMIGTRFILLYYIFLPTPFLFIPFFNILNTAALRHGANFVGRIFTLHFFGKDRFGLEREKRNTENKP